MRFAPVIVTPAAPIGVLLVDMDRLLKKVQKQPTAMHLLCLQLCMTEIARALMNQGSFDEADAMVKLATDAADLVDRFY